MTQNMTLRRTLAILAVGTVSLAATVHLADAQGGHRMTPPAFSEIDVDGDGAITRSDIEAFAQARFDAADTDGNGALSEDELQAQAMERAAERAAANATRMLNRMDGDGDGALSMAEMGEAHGRRGGGDPAGRMLQRADTDNDGAVSEAEYMTALEKMAERGNRRHGKGHGGDHRRGG